MERTALSLQSFRGPRLFLFVSSLAHAVQHMWDLGSPSRNGALWPLQGKPKSPNHWAAQGASCHVSTSFPYRFLEVGVQQEVPSGREGPSQGPSPCFLLQMGD